MSGLDRQRLTRLAEVMQRRVDAGDVGGVAWLVERDGKAAVGVAGTLTRDGSTAVRRDSIFRIASLTKPIVTVGALILVEECRLRLDDPVDDLLPELADRRVLVEPRGAVDGPTVAASRPITVRDVLTFQLGLGMDFAAPWPQPLLDAMDRLELGSGPPQPQLPPPPDEWMRRLSTLPLLYQPGERWLYNTGSDVLGVLIARAADQPLEEFLRQRVLEPLGMADTAFVTPDVARFGACYTLDPETGTPVVYDPPGGQWATAPVFPSGAGGMVSTVDDLHAFGRMLLRGGRLTDGSRVLTRPSVEAMTSDQVGVGDGAIGPSPDGSAGWGFGVGVQLRRTAPTTPVGSYGWAGGLGSAWANDPQERVIGVVLTTDAFTAAFPLPRTIRDFWTGAYAAIDD